MTTKFNKEWLEDPLHHVVAHDGVVPQRFLCRHDRRVQCLKPTRMKFGCKASRKRERVKGDR